MVVQDSCSWLYTIVHCSTYFQTDVRGYTQLYTVEQGRALLYTISPIYTHMYMFVHRSSPLCVSVQGYTQFYVVQCCKIFYTIVHNHT